jgi:CBS domain containing-hemolysin-like protein
VDQALEKVIQYGFSRYPVYERNIDNVIGIVTIKDLLHANKVNRDKVEIIKVMRDVFFIPESKNVLDLLKELQVRRMNMAVVLDEYGGTAGLVTIEDLLEEIVGDINDEYDKVTVPIEIISENHGIFDGKILVEDVNDSLNLDLPMEEGYDTVAGLVFHCLGKIPRKGDWVELDGIAVKVKEMEGNRIKKVEVIREKPPAETPAPIEE